jgi:hypothetical protein
MEEEKEPAVGSQKEGELIKEKAENSGVKR